MLGGIMDWRVCLAFFKKEFVDVARLGRARIIPNVFLAAA